MKSLSLLVLFAVVGCSPTPDILLVGHLNPSLDSSEERALRLSVDILNNDEANRPLARRVHIAHAETGKSLEELHAQAVRVATVNRALVLIGGMRADEASNIGDAAQADSILAFTGAGHLGPKPNPYLFCLGISPARQAKSLVGFAKEKGKRLLLVTSKQSPEPIAQAIRAEVKSAADLELREVVIPGDPGWQLALDPALGQTDVVFLCLNALERTRAVSDSLLGKIPASGAVILAGEEVDNLTPPGLKNCFTLASYPDREELAKNPFAAAYFKEHHSFPDPRALTMHDAFEVTVQLFKRAESVQTKKTKEELLKKDARFDTLTGPIQFLPDGTCSRVHWLVEWKDSGWKHVKKFE